MSAPVCQAAINLIKKFEDCKLVAYPCPAGIPSIGWGSTRGVTAADIKNKRTITQAEADERLVQDVAEAAAIVDASVSVPLTANQRGALVSFVYNVGRGKKGIKSGFVELKEGGQSTMLKRLNEGKYEDAAKQMDLWIYASGKKLNGLIRRRAAEKALFLTPDDQQPSIQEAPVAPIPPAKSYSRVGSGAAVSALAGTPLAWIVASLWNAFLPDNPMPIEVSLGLSSGVTTGVYLLVDYLSREKETAL